MSNSSSIDSKKLKRWITTRLAASLHIPVSKINTQKSFVDYGMGSLQAVNLSGEISKKLQLAISPTIFWEIDNIDQLVDFILNKQKVDKQPTLSKKVSNVKKSKSVNANKVAKDKRPDLYQQFPEIDALVKLKQQIYSIAKSPIYFRQNPGIATSCLSENSHEYINYSIYNYLNLAGDQEIIRQVTKAIKQYGTTAAASRIAGGDKPIHRELEHEIADFIGTEDCIVFNSGHATNVTVIGHMMNKNDLIICDQLSHNSIIQGAILSGATIKYFAHNNCKSLENILSEHRSSYRRVLIIVEGVYSMDGDIPDMPNIINLKKQYDALLYIDEAHSLGVIGKKGQGIREYFDLAPEDLDFWMGTLSKALVSCGGYIAGKKELIDYLKYTAPGFVYSCGLSPADTMASLASLKKIKKSPEIVTELQQRARLLWSLLKKGKINLGTSSDTPVIPVIVGDSSQAIKLAKRLLDNGIYVHPLFYPAVEENMARIRLFVTASHTEKQLNDTAKIIIKEIKKLKV